MRITVALLACALLSGCGHGFRSGTGKKIGQVIQLGQHGLICTTWEGKLVRGGFNTGSGVAGGVFEFTVEDEKMVKALSDAMEKQQELEVTYQKVSLSGLCTSESNHFITGVRVLGETTPSVIVNPPTPPADPKEAKRRELMRQLKELEESK